MIEEDRPDFDIYPNDDVLFSPEFTYSIRDKKYVIFRAMDVGYETLTDDAESNGYFNLDLLKQKSAVQKQDKLGKTTYEIMPQFTVYELWGKEYAIEKEKDGETTYKPGIDHNGQPLDDAEFIECIQTYATWEGNQPDESRKMLIGFRKSPRVQRVRIWAAWMTRFTSDF